MAKNKVLKVGFDLDGVILYNPARMSRPFVALAKDIFFKKRRGVFFIPHTPFQKFIWDILHNSSLFVAPGASEIKKLSKKGKIKAYIVTARYDFLQKDLQGWLKKIESQKFFAKHVENTKNEQPHIFKKRVIEELKLDIFVEDNWDIVKYIRGSKCKIFWISNIFDWGIKHKYKFINLRGAVAALYDELEAKN